MASEKALAYLIKGTDSRKELLVLPSPLFFALEADICLECKSHLGTKGKANIRLKNLQTKDGRVERLLLQYIDAHMSIGLIPG